MTGSFVATLRRELRIAARHGSEWLLPLIFFAVVVMLFALGAKPKDPSLQAFAPSILWVCALLAALLTTERLFRADFDQGLLEQLFLSPTPAMVPVCGKLLSHWLLTGLPMCLMSLPLSMQLSLNGAATQTLVLSLLLGTPILSLLSAFVAALTLGLPRAGMLLPVLVLPLLAPVVIFGAGAVRATQGGAEASGPIYLLAALLALSVTLLPWATTAALKNAFD
ncbi:MAG: heme exporter protein CcmB [Panacagrimonas sp.]